jgi:hypothetical protein
MMPLSGTPTLGAFIAALLSSTAAGNKPTLNWRFSGVLNQVGSCTGVGERPSCADVTPANSSFEVAADATLNGGTIVSRPVGPYNVKDFVTFNNLDDFQVAPFFNETVCYRLQCVICVHWRACATTHRRRWSRFAWPRCDCSAAVHRARTWLLMTARRRVLTGSHPRSRESVAVVPAAVELSNRFFLLHLFSRLCVRACVRVCVRACVRVCVRARVCVCVRACDLFVGDGDSKVPARGRRRPPERQVLQRHLQLLRY